ncbi:MAG: DISARM system phospholipase D-like protein DrmC [Candidatus Dormibacteraceae bacterium]
MNAIADLAARLAATLPGPDMGSLDAASRAGRDELARLRDRPGPPAVHAACGEILGVLDDNSNDYVAGCLAGAAAAARVTRETQRVEVVWSGPESDVDTGRLTSRVVVDLIGEARRRVLLVSYAAITEERITAALAGAIERGVDVTLVRERAVDNPAFRSSDEAFVGLPLRRVVWPADRRPEGAALHPKLIVVDGRSALVGSANLTGRALDANLECGVLIRGGPQPKSISDHIWSLIHSGTLAVSAS